MSIRALTVSWNNHSCQIKVGLQGNLIGAIICRKKCSNRVHTLSLPGKGRAAQSKWLKRIAFLAIYKRFKNTTYTKLGTSELLFPELTRRRTLKERERTLASPWFSPKVSTLHPHHTHRGTQNSNNSSTDWSFMESYSYIFSGGIGLMQVTAWLSNVQRSRLDHCSLPLLGVSSSLFLAARML